MTKGIPTPSVKRQRQGPIGMHCDAPLMLENRPPPIFKRHHRLALAADA